VTIHDRYFWVNSCRLLHHAVTSSHPLTLNYCSVTAVMWSVLKLCTNMKKIDHMWSSYSDLKIDNLGAVSYLRFQGRWISTNEQFPVPIGNQQTKFE